VHKCLLQLISVPFNRVFRGREPPVKSNRLGLKLRRDKANRMIKRFVKSNGSESAFAWSAESQHLSDYGVNARVFAAHDLAQLIVGMLLEQQFDECFTGDERVLDFVGHACR